MAKECTMSFQQRSLFQQGFQKYSPAELKQLEWGLRFTPAACSLIAAYGLYTQQPAILFAVAVLGFWAFFFPSAHPMDLIYNHLVRHLFGAVKLPANPFQRRLACLSAGLMNIAAGILFLLGMPIAALVVGVSLLILQAIVIFTHFCTLSWMYEGVMRMLGKWQKPLDEEEAKNLINSGAKIVDVRSQNEYAKESLEGAVNFPLEDLDQLRDEFKQSPCLLFCNSGTRSHIASEKLKTYGIQNVYNLGDFNRARQIVQATG
ncbi:MAG: DUF4395 family protein [Thioalkalispiraceae bacterium]|jgi:rhodanese-related sulfurtransferase